MLSGERTGPLAGVRIIDLTRMMAGPFATMLLSDLGADVIKVEPPGGDFTRTSGVKPAGVDDPSYRSFFASINRNKRSIELDLKSETGRTVLRDLVETADALVENFRPGVMDRFGLSYESLAETNTRLVYASVRGYGDPRLGESPYANWPMFDVNAQALGGLMHLTGQPDGDPTQVGVGIGDIFPGTLLALGVVSALMHVRAGGEGQYVDVSMYDGVMAMCERAMHQYSYSGVAPKRQNGHPFSVPFDVFPAKDGWVSIACVTDAQWRTLAELMQRPDLASDPRFALRDARNSNRPLVERLVRDWTLGRSRSEVVELLGGRVPVAPVNSAADIAADPHAVARQMLVEVQHPGSDTTGVVIGSPIKMSKTPPNVYARAPLLNEHEDDVLAEAARRKRGAP